MPWKRADVASLTKPLLLGAIALAAIALVPALAGRGFDLSGGLELLGNDRAGPEAQSDAQISSAEFADIEEGIGLGRLRALVGEPASTGSTEVEGLELECWYYGVAGSTGAYQLCFENGRLSTKTRFSRG